MKTLRLGTRGSRLALVQSELIARRLRQAGVPVELVTIVTQGDLRPIDSPIGDGVFVADLESALSAGTIDVAVHSAKDLPLDNDPELPIVAYPERADPFDALVSRKGETSLAQLRPHARVGTDSARRTAFVLAVRPDLEVIPLMGNVDRRVERLDAGEADALVLAAAGLDRLGLSDRISARLEPRIVPPAPAQGALAVQARADDFETIAALTPLDDPGVRLAVIAERAVLKAFGGGCRAAVGALANVSGGAAMTLFAGAAEPRGESSYALTWLGSARDPDVLAEAASMVAAELIRRLQLQPRALLDTRPDLDALGSLLLNRAGNRVVHVPTVAISPLADTRALDRARGALDSYDWVVLTSRRGVDALFDGLGQAPPSSLRWAAVGPTTAKALRERGVGVDAEPALAVGEAIPAAMAMGGPLSGARVLLARADSAAASLPRLLRLRGADVDDVVAYHSVAAPASSRRPLAEALADPALEGVIFASGSAVRGLVELAGDGLDRARRLKAFTIGPKTTASAREHGFDVTAEALTPDAAGIEAAVRSGFEAEVARWVESQFPTSS